MSHDNEYFPNMITMLELIWGDGYMAPGGPGNVARLLRGLDTKGKRILDIGCGIGGPVFEMVRTHGATVVGIDLEAPLIERAQQDAQKHGLSDQCTFQTVEAGPLPFDDQTFDIVISSGAFTQIADKSGILGESLRVLKPGGHVSCYDWLKPAGDEYSDDMLYWFKVEGLTYALETLESYAQVLRDVGFVDIDSEDATDWYRQKAREEYTLIKGDLYPRMVELLGQEDADHFVENWRAMVVVIDKGEMRQGYSRGRRPK
ncbi:MAG: methyltransferase domain-containing protein [Woeseiaceae bacterium]